MRNILGSLIVLVAGILLNIGYFVMNDDGKEMLAEKFAERFHNIIKENM